MVPATPPASAGVAKPVSLKSQDLPGPASKIYNVATTWETTAALNEVQLRAIEVVSGVCTQRPYPKHATEDTSFAPETPAQQGKETYSGTLEDAVLHNTNSFHKWHSELEAACALATEEKYKKYAELLNQHLRICEDVLGKVNNTLDGFDALLGQHKDVSQRSKALYNSCEQLVKEKEQLVTFAEALRAKLKTFEEFESVAQQFQAVQLSVDSEQFLPLLGRLDECVAYFTGHPQYADSAVYLNRFRQLQSRALALVRGKVQQALKHAMQQVQVAMAEAVAPQASGRQQEGASSSGASVTQRGAPPMLAEGAEVAVLYVRFRAAAAPALRGLFQEFESRVQQPEYARLLAECHTLYCQARLQLVGPFVQQRIQQQLGQAPALLTRNGCEQLMRVCQLEVQLFEAFFTPGDGELEALSPLCEPLCTLLYDVLRPMCVHLQDMEELCELVDILKHEVLQEQAGRRGSSIEAMRPMLQRILADLQERLIYRCQAFIREEVASYQPDPADLDFPAKLLRAATASSNDSQPAATSDTSNGDHAADGEAEHTNGNAAASPSPEPEAQVDSGDTWYPPVRSTLVCLSQLYRAVSSKTFGGLAQEALAACTASVQHASRLVARRSGGLDGQLFMIRHLLLLREKIAPFDVEFAVTDIDLDFTHMRDHLRKILGGQLSLFSFTSSNAMVQMLGKGGPRVMQTHLDSKRELEGQLKMACEALIMALTKVAVEPLLSFLTKVTAVRVAAASNPAVAAVPLRDQAFADPRKLADIVGKVNEALRGPLPAAVSKMSLYLSQASTCAVLFRPVKSSIAEAHGQVAALLEREYTQEQAAQIPLMPPDQLAALLDAMS